MTQGEDESFSDFSYRSEPRGKALPIQGALEFVNNLTFQDGNDTRVRVIYKTVTNYVLTNRKSKIYGA